MDQILRSHVIDPEALRSDDFDEFFRLRAEDLLTRIEGAMDKPLYREAAPADGMDECAAEEREDVA